MEMQKSLLRLFKGFYSEEKAESFNERGFKYGLLIPDFADDSIVEDAIQMYGKDGKQWNNTFHKSFQTVADKDINTLISQQLTHYFTTYGLEILGLYSEETVYIPAEKLEIPELKEDVDLIYIRPLTTKQVNEKLMTLLTSGIALSKDTVEDVMLLSDFLRREEFDDIKNREVKIALYDRYGVVPKNPDEFLRYLIYKLTGKTLKIQSKELIEELQCSDIDTRFDLLNKYVNTVGGYEKLSSIFLRNKKLFLALKVKSDNYYYDSKKTTRTGINLIINKLRKLAKKNHKPLKDSLLNHITDVNYNSEHLIHIDFEELTKELNDATVFRVIRILNALSYRMTGNNAMLYKIRNGKTYAKQIDSISKPIKTKFSAYHEYIYTYLVMRMTDKVNGKVVYIPSNITYAAPTSEKMFVGNIPVGSCVSVPRDSNMVYGIHWFNKNGRVDLDIKQMNKNESFGWDAQYKTSNNSILFSGDLTTAPEPLGATEVFYVSRDYGYGAWLITLNNFTANNEEIPFEFMVAKEDNPYQATLSDNYVVDPNNILAQCNLKVVPNQYDMVIGLMVITDEDIKLYFEDFSQGSNISSRQTEAKKIAFDFLQQNSRTRLKLHDLLTDAGAIVINSPTYKKSVIKENEDGSCDIVEEEIKADIDLSLEAITKDTIIDLFS